MEPGFFEVVRNAFEGFVAGVSGRRNIYVHSRGLKVWFDDDTREHYESQLIRVDGEVQLEIGFHAEYPATSLAALAGAASPRSGRHPTRLSSTRQSRPRPGSRTTSSRWSLSAGPQALELSTDASIEAEHNEIGA